MIIYKIIYIPVFVFKITKIVFIKIEKRCNHWLGKKASWKGRESVTGEMGQELVLGKQVVEDFVTSGLRRGHRKKGRQMEVQKKKVWLQEEVMEQYMVGSVMKGVKERKIFIIISSSSFTVSIKVTSFSHG